MVRQLKVCVLMQIVWRKMLLTTCLFRGLVNLNRGLNLALILSLNFHPCYVGQVWILKCLLKSLNYK